MRTGLLAGFFMVVTAGLTVLAGEVSAGAERKAPANFNEFELDQIFAFVDWDNPPEAKPAPTDGELKGDREMKGDPDGDAHCGPACRRSDDPHRGKEPHGPEMGDRRGGMDQRGPEMGDRRGDKEPRDPERNDGNPENVGDAQFQAIMDYLARECPDELAEVRNLRQQAETARQNSDEKFRMLVDKGRAVIMARQKKFEQFGDLIRQYRESKDAKLLEQIKVRLNEFYAESLDDMKKEIKVGERSLQEMKKQYDDRSVQKDQEIARELKQIADGI